MTVLSFGFAVSRSSIACKLRLEFITILTNPSIVVLPDEAMSWSSSWSLVAGIAGALAKNLRVWTWTAGGVHLTGALGWSGLFEVLRLRFFWAIQFCWESARCLNNADSVPFSGARRRLLKKSGSAHVTCWKENVKRTPIATCRNQGLKEEEEKDLWDLFFSSISASHLKPRPPPVHSFTVSCWLEAL